MNNTNEPNMPFGKYKGTPLSEVPKWYLKWCVETIDLREPLASQIDAVLDGRLIPVSRPKLDADWHLNPDVLQKIDELFRDV